MTLEEQIEYMINHGSSLILNWGEDTGCFEVDWITGGKRFRGVKRSLLDAMREAVQHATEHFGALREAGIG